MFHSFFSSLEAKRKNGTQERKCTLSPNENVSTQHRVEELVNLRIFFYVSKFTRTYSTLRFVYVLVCPML